MDVDVPGNPGAKRASRMSATYGNMTNPAYPHQTYFHTSESNSPCRTNKAQISFLGKTKPIFSWTCARHIQTFVPHFDYPKPTPYYLGQTTHSLYNLSVTPFENRAASSRTCGQCGRRPLQWLLSSRSCSRRA